MNNYIAFEFSNYMFNMYVIIHILCNNFMYYIFWLTQARWSSIGLADNQHFDITGWGVSTGSNRQLCPIWSPILCHNESIIPLVSDLKGWFFFSKLLLRCFGYVVSAFKGPIDQNSLQGFKTSWFKMLAILFQMILAHVCFSSH